MPKRINQAQKTDSSDRYAMRSLGPFRPLDSVALALFQTRRRSTFDRHGASCVLWHSETDHCSSCSRCSFPSHRLVFRDALACLLVSLSSTEIMSDDLQPLHSTYIVVAELLWQGWAGLPPRGLGNEHGTIMLGRILYMVLLRLVWVERYFDVNRTRSVRRQILCKLTRATGLPPPPQPRHLLTRAFLI